jgi:two-component system nitrate/nitrite response regulator NarL
MRLGICDDEPIFVEALASVFRGRGHDVLEFATTADLLARVADAGLEVCVVDVFFAGDPAIEATQQLLSRHPSVATIVLTGYAENPLLDGLRRFPSLTVLSKAAGLDEIVRVVELRARGPVHLGRWQTGPSRASGWNERLTAREREVLVMLANGASTAAVARSLGMRVPTARSHIQNVLQKLGVHSRVEAVSVAMHRDLLSAVDLRPDSSSGTRPVDA